MIQSTAPAVRCDSYATPIEVLDATRPYFPAIDGMSDADFDAAYAAQYGEPGDLPPATAGRSAGPDCGDLVRVNAPALVRTGDGASFVALSVGQLGKVMGFATGVTACQFNGVAGLALVVDDAILDVTRRNPDRAASWDFEALEDLGFVADLNAEGDAADVPLDVTGRSCPWDDVQSGPAGNFTFGVLADGWDVPLAAEDVERADRERSLADLEWERKALEVDRMYAGASRASDHAEFRGFGPGHDLD